jgi:hypothetical protein
MQVGMNLAVVTTSSTVFEGGMEYARPLIVHGLSEATAALAEAAVEGSGVTLISAPGAALYAGCGWWRALVEAARSAHPDVPCIDILDCADGTGQALAALRIGVTRLVLWPDAPGREAVVAIAEAMGGFVLPTPPAGTPGVSATGANGGPASGDKSRSPG